MDECNYCVECGCDLTHMDDGDDTCCWCLERIKKENSNDYRTWVLLSSWSQHYKSWCKSKNFRKLIVKYEDFENNILINLYLQYIYNYHLNLVH